MNKAEENDPWTIPDSAYGAVKEKQKEQAITIQMITSWKLARAKICHVTSFLDETNAFGSPEHDVLDVIDEQRSFPEDAFAHKANIHDSTLRLHCSDGVLHARNKQGVLQGHVTAPRKFIMYVPWVPTAPKSFP